VVIFWGVKQRLDGGREKRENVGVVSDILLFAEGVLALLLAAPAAAEKVVPSHGGC
jgi:hypothetical protein